MFEDREKAIENKYALDEEFRFRVHSRAVRLVGLWAALQLGRADADAYADEVVESDFDEPGIGDVIRKVIADFSAAGLSILPADIQKEYDRCIEEAKRALA